MPERRLVLLLVAPDEADHRTLTELVDDFGDLRWATSVDAALDVLDEQLPDAVLLAGGLGSDALQRLLDEDPRAAIVELGDSSDLTALAAAHQRGAVDHLPRHGLTTDTLQRALLHAVEHRRALERVRHDALHDALTGLPNRTLFLDRLTWSLRRARRRGDGRRCCAVLFLDLDGFKDVNDSLGHQAGDALLRMVAERLAGALRPGDTVARQGGDEFTVLLEDIDDPREATAIAERVQAALAEPIRVADHDLVVSTSIGIALAGADAQPEGLLRDADVAMYRAKGEGKARHAVFDGRMHRQVRDRLDLEASLSRAVEERRIELRYLPIFHTESGTVAGVEALCRWSVDTQKLISVAEESGLIVPLGRFVLHEAARHGAEWRIPVSVNVSGRQLRDPRFAAAIESALRQSDVSAEHLRLEVTEQAMSGHPDGTLRTLLDIRRRLGVRAHLDDFGAGVSSLRFLHRFPGDVLKVDRALVTGMLGDPGAQEIVRAIAALAHTLRMEVIAEGVETAAQLDRVKLLGCEFVQGFHLSTPLTADEVRDLLQRAGARTPA
jgi:diguanylate cyclase (GGDEF)-like protein